MGGSSYAALPSVPSGELALKVDKTTTVNTKPLSGNVALTLDDIPATATKTTVLPATQVLAELGAKSTVAVTMNAFGSWTTGMTIVLPGIGSHTIQVDGTPGDIDIRTLSETAAKAAICTYLNAHAGATCLVTIVGTSTTMTVTALAYGRDLNGAAITGTLLAAGGTMAGGRSPQIAATPAARRINAQTGTSYTFSLDDTLDAGTELNTFANVAAIIATVPKHSVVAFPVGCTIPIQQTGAGQLAIAPVDGDVTINPAATLKISEQWKAAQLTQTAENVWSLIGSLSA